MEALLSNWLFVSLTAVAMVLGSQNAFPGDNNNKPSAPPNDDYQPGPDSQRQPGVPAGKTFQFTFDNSKIFPGATRSITVYVPAQYKAEKPACVYIGLDALGFLAPLVFDNLIHKKEMPLVIGIGVSPGHVPSVNPPNDPRFNRSLEFDGLSDNLARCLIEEILPEVERHKTPDGLPIVLSKDPNDRCVGGGSTGGIGAFTLAWERPDAFRRVFTAIATFVCMRGGDRYPVLVRKTEPKPIRIFMQDGSHDQWMGGPEVGDWWMGNQSMQRALEFAGYQVRHVWGEGPHSGRHATAIFPDAMRWLWKDWPQPITAGESQNVFLKAILQPGQDWQLAAGGHASAGALASDQHGEVFFQDAADQKICRIANDGKASVYCAVGGIADGLAFGPDGRLYVAHAASAKIAAYDAAGKLAMIAEGIRGQGLVVAHSGNIYVTESDKVWLVKPSNVGWALPTTLDTGLNHATGVALSPDGLWLAVAENKTHWGYSYRVQPDGTLQDKQRFYWFHVPDWADDSGVRAWCMDRDGRLYAATRMGVQVFDRNGRSRCILPAPYQVSGTGAVSGGEAEARAGAAPQGICFGGAAFDTLYVTCGDKVYKRTLKVLGAQAWAAPIKLPPWGGG